MGYLNPIKTSGSIEMFEAPIKVIPMFVPLMYPEVLIKIIQLLLYLMLQKCLIKWSPFIKIMR